MAIVKRPEVIQALLDLFPRPRYLEIGVNKGVTFHAVAAAHKVAVDPKFVFDERPDPGEDRTAEYFEVPSDRYFGALATPGEKFDVIYLDGLHTFEQTLRDLINALEFLAPDGIILIDDIKPDSYPAALPDGPTVRAMRKHLKMENHHSWMGDVYKLAFFIDTFLQQFTYACISNNHGQLVMWRQPRASVTQRSIEAISRLQFYHCATEAEVFHFRPFDKIMTLIEEARA